MIGSVERLPKTPHASFCTTGLSGNSFIALAATLMNPRLTTSSLYFECLHKLRTMPSEASMRLTCFCCVGNTAANDDRKPDANNEDCTSELSAEHVQIAEATEARMSATVGVAPGAATIFSNAVVRASIPPFVNTAVQQSSFTAKLLKKRHTATTNEGIFKYIFNKLTISLTPPLCDIARRCLVRFDISASVVIASSSKAVLSLCLRKISMIIGTEFKRFMIVSEFSTTLKVAIISRQLRIIATSTEAPRRAVVAESKPFCIARLSVA
mmetsp:Transcript_18513/g.30041  ORF Transcript_18513/g.30041 Transcript_18513/m.30041 type:complete len:268 (-) Transcript_18513:329-1132(-)